jgi:hypothetical protein
MAACNACGTTIVFGGVKEGNLRYCNAVCHSRGGVARIAMGLPPDVVRNEASAVFHGSCPKCQGPGPVDVHTSHQIWSALLLTQYKSTPQISCKRCGVKSQISNALFSAVLGWWGFPWGIIMTPVQITRNVMGIFRSDAVAGPSPDLERMVSMSIAAHTAQRYQ